MAVGTYWVGEIPTRPLSIKVMDEFGQDANLTGYDAVSLRLLDTNNDVVDLSDVALDLSLAAAGRIYLGWPEDHSLFEEPGEYVLQMELHKGTQRDITSTYTFNVKQAGGVI